MSKSSFDLPRDTHSPVPANDLDFFETQLAGGLVRFRIAYSAVRQLRTSQPPGAERVGLVWGSNSLKVIQIERCESFHSPSGQALDDAAAIRDATRGFNQEESEGSSDLKGSPIGIFRTQMGSWASSTESDARLVAALLAESHSDRGFFLLIRKFDHRPWSATLFIAPAGGPATEVLEFPFDDYLLINGYTANLAVPSEPEPPQPLSGWWRKILWAAIPAALLVSAIIYNRRSSETFDLEEAGISAAASLGLNVQRRGDDFEVSWNRLSSAVLEASGGSLSIRDGGITKTVQLGAAQLREGRIVYSPLTEDLDFRFEIQASDKKTQAESVQVFEWKPTPDLGSPALQVGGGRTYAPPITQGSEQKASIEPRRITLPPGVKRDFESSQQNAKPVPAAPSSLSPVVPAAESSKEIRPLPQSTLPPQLPRNAEQEPVVLPESPNSSPSGSIIPKDTTVAQTPAPPSPEAPVTRQIKVFEGLQPSKLLKQVRPVYPLAALMARIEGVVRFQAVIGKDGRVRNLQFVSGTPMLTKAASDAVSQWIYRPALLSGEPVEVVTQIDINFSLSH